jgi:glycosyltransferase involved in cell wall biosynthesis
MPRVLIPSDNRDFVTYLAKAYQQAGWEAVLGAANFDIGAAAFDLVHFQWPEEFSGWNVPGDSRLAEIRTRLGEWSQRSRLVLTAHNLCPHRNGDAENYRKLYEAFYERVHVVAHFTAFSRDAVTSKYPAAANARQVVAGYHNLDALLPAERDAARARRDLGISTDAFVVLVFGGLREWAEVELIIKGFDAASIPGKRLLMCGRYDESGPAWRQRWRRWTLSRWLRKRNAVVIPGFIPDAEVHRVVDAADAVVIPRFRSMNSGLPALGASFGKIIVAPRCGSYPELLEGTSHPIYQPGDATSLSRALEAASRLDRAIIESECQRLVASWSWPELMKAVIAAAGR